MLNIDSLNQSPRRVASQRHATAPGGVARCMLWASRLDRLGSKFDHDALAVTGVAEYDITISQNTPHCAERKEKNSVKPRSKAAHATNRSSRTATHQLGHASKTDKHLLDESSKRAWSGWSRNSKRSMEYFQCDDNAEDPMPSAAGLRCPDTILHQLPASQFEIR